MWQCEPHYRKSPAAISSLFDSVYVSFYKILGGITGAVLAGEVEFIAEARLWQRRYGGNLVRLYPYVVSARSGLRKHLPKMRRYVARAQEIAEVISALPGVSIAPRSVVTNMMYVYIAASPDAVGRENLAIARDERVAITGCIRSCAVPNTSFFEVSSVRQPMSLAKTRLSVGSSGSCTRASFASGGRCQQPQRTLLGDDQRLWPPAEFFATRATRSG